MIRFSHAFVVIFTTLLVGCGNNSNKEKEASNETSTGTSSSSNTPETTPAANQPKSYTVAFAPDSAILGKSNEALIKVIGATAVALTDPDGKDKGIEFVVKLQATNKQSIGTGSSFSVSYADSRLQLDNGTNITVETGTDYLRAEPESSSNIESWTYQIPAGAKATALNLFMNGTRVSMAITMK